ncbi:hypothetical protein D3C78_1176260 [compost metagenome]
MQPHDISEDGDDARGVNHRGITKETLVGEGRNDFREDAESRQHQDVNFGMAPDPDEVNIHHRIAAEIVGEEIGANVTVKGQKGERAGQDRERSHDQDVRTQRRPDEDRQAHHGHARGAHLDDRHDQVDAR